MIALSAVISDAYKRSIGAGNEQPMIQFTFQVVSIARLRRISWNRFTQYLEPLA